MKPGSSFLDLGGMLPRMPSESAVSPMVRLFWAGRRRPWSLDLRLSEPFRIFGAVRTKGMGSSPWLIVRFNESSERARGWETNINSSDG